MCVCVCVGGGGGGGGGFQEGAEASAHIEGGTVRVGAKSSLPMSTH